jgi:hypothetical protein
MSESEIDALVEYQRKHATCDIQNHPWQGVFGAGYVAGVATLTARAEAAEQREAALREREQRLTAWIEQVGNVFQEFHTVRHVGKFEYCVRSTCVDARATLASSPSPLAASPPAAPAGEPKSNVQKMHITPAADSQDAEASRE